MIFEYESYRDYLKQLAADRCAKNPSYSMRAMASNLGLAPSTFSEVLSGKKNLSFDTASIIAQKLGLKSKEADYFCLLVQLEGTRDFEVKSRLQEKIKNLNSRRDFQILSVDRFKAIAEWYHLAILSALRLSHFDSSVSNISRTFKISKIETEMAINRLLRLGLIERDKNNKLVRKVADLWITDPGLHQSLNLYHKQMLQKASESIEGQARDERIIRTENIVLDDDQLAKADLLVEEFFKKMSDLTSKAKKKNRLYHLSAQFFKLLETGGNK
jgi:uncharacterized protein (TIGR02147 family)